MSNESTATREVDITEVLSSRLDGMEVRKKKPAAKYRGGVKAIA
jgi:hypothetical protein